MPDNTVQRRNIRLILDFWEKVFNQRDYAFISQVLAENYTFNGQPQSPQDLQQWIEETHQTHEDLFMEIVNVFAEGNKVVVRNQVTYKDPQTQLPMVVYSHNIITLQNDRAISNWQGGPDKPIRNEDFSEKNKSAMKWFWDEFFGKKQFKVAHDFLAPNYTYNGVFQTAEELIQWAEGLFQKYPDFQNPIVDIMAQGNQVALRWEARFTDTDKKVLMKDTATNIIILSQGQAVSNQQSGGGNPQPA